MRMKAHDMRSLENVVKPNMPIIGSEEKERILKQYFETKQKLQQAIENNWSKIQSLQLFVC